MSEPKTMVINCALCDATQTREETLQAYDQVIINAATVLVSEESSQLLHRYNVSLNSACTPFPPAASSCFTTDVTPSPRTVPRSSPQY